MCRKFQRSLFWLGISAVLFLLIIVPSVAFASGITLPEQGQPGVGTATVGSAAQADDASTVFYNPAGMTRLDRSELLGGLEGLFGPVKFKSDPNIEHPFAGGDGGNASYPVLPAGGLYYVYKPSQDANYRLGFAFNSLAGMGLDYDGDWRGRYEIQNSFCMILNMNPSIAFKINDQLSVGAGVSVMYGLLSQEIAIPSALPLGPPDGKAAMTLDDWQVGYNIGGLYEPQKGTRIGVAYRSEVTFDLEGDVTLDNLGPLLDEKAIKDNMAKTQLPIPQSIMVSLYQDLNDRWAIVVDGGWQDWSVMNKTVVTTMSGATLTLKRNWEDTWHTGVGLLYRLNDRVRLKAGIAYDSNPQPTDSRWPDMPIDENWRYAGGLDYKINEDTSVSLSYTFLDLGSARIDKEIPPGTLFPGRQFRGEYDQYMHIVAISFRKKFGN